MGVISARIDDRDEAYLKERFPNLSEALRAVVRQKVDELRRREALTWLDEHAVDAPSRTEDLVRKARDD